MQNTGTEDSFQAGQKAPVHQPVMVDEVLLYLNLKNAQLVVDGTCGEGGHSQAILSHLPENATLLVMDRDQEVLEVAKGRLSGKGRILFANASYAELVDVLRSYKLSKPDAVLLDLGMSTYHIKEKERGFSFDSPSLDMRYDRTRGITAEDFLAEGSEEEIGRVLRDYGEERKAKYIARLIVKERKHNRITSGKQLANLIERHIRRQGRIHPATCTFQALRIYVNDELDHLMRFLEILPYVVAQGGRFVSITFHSLEDRIVKNSMREYAQKGYMRILTKKVVRPSADEVYKNPNSRSARLRAVEMII
jgi:16S rRNA (cytosine1402-N4)-methyltransferase